MINQAMLKLKLVPFAVLETNRLVLRQINAADIPLLYLLRTNPAAMAFTDRDKPSGIDEISNLIDQMNADLIDNKGISWCLTFPGEDKLIGIAGFWRTMPEHYRAELGYMLHPNYWGQGYMLEALTCILNYAFDRMGLHSIEANVNPNNKPSIGLLKKLGFAQEAYFKENYYYHGAFLDSVIYSLLTPYRNQENKVNKHHSVVLSNREA